MAYGRGGKLYQPNVPEGRIRYVENQIRPIIRKEIARLTKNRPTFNVIPNSPDEQDANAARLGDDVLTYLWRHLSLSKKRKRALTWSRICGAGFLKVFWDPTIGNSVEALAEPTGGLVSGPSGGIVRPGSPDAEAMHALAAQQGMQLVVKKISQGDVRVEVRSPFQMFVDPLADAFEEAEWLVEESIKSHDYVLERYKADIEADTPANPGLVEARMGGAAITQGTGGYKGVKLREYWCMPCITHPQGCKVVWTPKGNKGDGQVLEVDNAPFDAKPYVMFNGIPMPGRLVGTGVAEDLRGPQTELNKVRSQMAENRNRVGNPTITASRQAIQDPDKFVQSMTQPGGVVWFDETGSQAAIPGFLQAPPLPEYVVQEPELIMAAMQNIAGQHEVSSAQVPPGVTAAAAIDLLQESDDTMLAPDVEDHEFELAELGTKLLNLVGRYYTDTRMLEISGDNASWQIFDFRGEMLQGNTRVLVQAGSAFPRSKAAMRAQMQDWLMYMAQSGTPLQGRQLAQFFEDWGFGGQAKWIQEFDDTETQCNRENALLAQGQPLPTNDYDDDEQHIAIHESFQRQPRYALLVGQNPQLGQIFEQHVAAHRQKLALLQQQQAQMMLQAQGQDPQAQAQQQQQEMQMQQQQQAQQQQVQAAQAQQQMDLKGAQQAQAQGFSQAQSEQQQRQAEERHQQTMQQAAERHQQQMHLQQQAHEARLAQIRQQQRGRNDRNGPERS